ncbi:MAG: alpha/beta hydrolase, partial [Planctomycetia bacterium]
MTTSLESPTLPSAGRARVFRGAEDLSLHAVDFPADPDAEPLGVALVLPFTAGHVRPMLPITAALAAAGFHAVALDPPGHGRSDGPRGVFTMPGLFDSLRRVVDELHDEHRAAPLTVVGSSWGGDLALLFALWEAAERNRTGRPPRVGAVVAQAAVTPWQRDLFRTLRAGVGILFDPTGVGREFIATAIGERLSVPSIFNVQRMYDDPDRRRRFRRDP